MVKRGYKGYVEISIAGLVFLSSCTPPGRTLNISVPDTEISCIIADGVDCTVIRPACIVAAAEKKDEVKVEYQDPPSRTGFIGVVLNLAAFCWNVF